MNDLEEVMECSLPSHQTGVLESVSTLKGMATTHSDLSRLEEWDNRKFLNSTGGKCKCVHLERKILQLHHPEIHPAAQSESLAGQQTEHELAACLSSKNNQPYLK